MNHISSMTRALQSVLIVSLFCTSCQESEKDKNISDNISYTDSNKETHLSKSCAELIDRVIDRTPVQPSGEPKLSDFDSICGKVATSEMLSTLLDSEFVSLNPHDCSPSERDGECGSSGSVNIQKGEGDQLIFSYLLSGSDTRRSGRIALLAGRLIVVDDGTVWHLARSGRLIRSIEGAEFGRARLQQEEAPSAFRCSGSLPGRPPQEIIPDTVYQQASPRPPTRIEGIDFAATFRAASAEPGEPATLTLFVNGKSKEFSSLDYYTLYEQTTPEGYQIACIAERLWTIENSR